MNNFQFLRRYQRLQYEIMYDELIDLGFATVGYSKTDKSSFWNLALTDKLLAGSQLLEIEEKFKSLDRNSTIYFENRLDLTTLIDFLESKYYKKSFEDSWQFWAGGEIDTRYFGSVKKVSSERGLKTFLETFDACYQEGDPQNPYGELGDYLKVAEEVWYRHNKSGRLEYFVVFRSGKPVAVSTLTNFEGIGYISNVGSLREVRGEGFGKAATLYCVDQSVKHGNTQHCLATEEGEYPNEFYKRIGFETIFRAVGYTRLISTSNNFHTTEYGN